MADLKPHDRVVRMESIEEHLGRDVPKCTVRADGVVVVAPGLDGRRSIVEVDKPGLTQALVAELPVEALDVAVLHAEPSV